MTPGARISAAIELLDSILVSWQTEKRFPADKQLDFYFKSHRYIGSGDRGAISELIYWVLRNKAAVEWYVHSVIASEAKQSSNATWIASSPTAPRNDARKMIFAALILRKDFNQHSILMLAQDGKYAPTPLTEEEKALCKSTDGKPLEFNEMPLHVRLNYPKWLEEKLKESFGTDMEKAMRAMNEQATTDLRVNTLKTTRGKLLEALRAEGFAAELTPMSPVGLRLPKRAPVFTSKFFREGHFEVQDEGSQMVAQLVDAKPGMRVIDFCAGAGGKTLAIAAQMENKGRILAWDTSQKRLGQITLRLRRAGVGNVQTHIIESENDSFIKRHKQTADRVLVDAPCSGTGTWRRNPDLKWRFTQKDLDEVLAVQQSILQSAARLVKPGGRLIYATCSVLREENEKQVERLLTAVSDFRVVCAQKIWDKIPSEGKNGDVSYLWLTPHQDGVDGFFAAVLTRQAVLQDNENGNKE